MKKDENIVEIPMLENSTYRFAKSLQRRFGKIEGITDKNYVTNSFHINVKEKIDAFSKLKFESQFQEMSSGGWSKSSHSHLTA